MRRRNAQVIALLISCLLTTAIRGQEPASSGPSKSLLAKQKWIRFVVVQGRVLAIVPRGQNGAMSSPENAAIRETLGIHGQGDATLVRYERTCSKQVIQVRFHSQGELDIERRPLAPDIKPLRFKQPVHGPVTVCLGDEGNREVHEAPTLWHLLILQPAVGREELIPVLQVLRPDWRLAQRTEQIEAALLASSDGGSSVDWDQWVAELADPRFSTRQSAERRLLASGQSVLPYLENLDVRLLNGEQRARIASIRTSLNDTSEDSPSRVSAWMVNDARLWRAWNDRGSLVQQTQAEFHLARLANKSGERPVVANKSLARTTTRKQ